MLKRKDQKVHQARLDDDAAAILDELVAQCEMQGEAKSPGRIMGEALLIYLSIARGVVHIEDGPQDRVADPFEGARVC